MQTTLSIKLVPLALACCFALAGVKPAFAFDQKCGRDIVLDSAVDPKACSRLEEFAGTLVPNSEEPPHVFRQQAKAHAERLQALLVSEGYYAALVTPRFSGGEALAVEYLVTPERRFKVTDHSFIYASAVQDGLPGSLKDMGLKPSSSPQGEELVRIQKAALSYLHNNGRPSARVLNKQVLANFTTYEARIVYEIEPGSSCVYGPLKVQGLDRLKPEIVLNKVKLREGAACSLEEMEARRLDLARTGLFLSAEIKPGPKEDARKNDHSDIIEINLREAKARTVSAGISYATNRGLGARVSWEHRNLFGGAERIRASLDVEEIRQSGSLSYRKPLLDREVEIFAKLGAATEAREAFDANLYSISFGADFPAPGPWKAKSSIEYEYGDIEDQEVREKGHRVTVPLILSQSTIDDILDAKKGIVLTLTASPTYASYGDGTSYVKVEARVSHHLPLTNDHKRQISTWGHAGSLQGGTASEIPATQLYYGGGSKSVRAIAWEHLGALDAAGIPAGGRSILAGGIEFRMDLAKVWQLVSFVEGGRVFEAATPDFEEDILWGGGLGLRYQTPIGPVRVDIAVPFDARRGDDDYQVYIGLGQAF